MKKLFNFSCGHTIVTHLFSPRTPGEAGAEARNAEVDGADAIAVELHKLPESFRSKEVFQQIISSVPLPFMFLIYRNDTLGWSDERRQELLFEAADAGAGIIDVMGDLFNPSPDERTRDKDAIRRQMEVIEEIHKRGSQVIMSSHPLRVMTPDEVLDQLKDFEQRGADVVKIVTKVDTDEDFAQSVRTTLRLHRELEKPFVHLCGGRFSRIQRMTGLALGNAITFGVHAYHDFAGYNQPAIRDFKTVQRHLHWNVADYPLD